ncbi:MAG TPA: hypothetical protein VGB42_04860 [Candidatus Thermoplasmatota archaeon]
MSGLRAPSRKVLVGLLLVAAVGSVAAVAAGEYLVAPLQPAPAGTAVALGDSGDGLNGEPEGYRCNGWHSNPFGWLG